MTQKPVVAIFGNGKIGSACFRLLKHLIDLGNADISLTSDDLKVVGNELIHLRPFAGVDVKIVDGEPEVLRLTGGTLLNVEQASVEDITAFLKYSNVTHIINALPFFLNVKLANAGVLAGCNYIDFTEDDKAAAEVRQLYNGLGLMCAPKCGLAPGFVNYVGADLVSQLKTQDKDMRVHELRVRVGALPRNVSVKADHLGNAVADPAAYALTWSIDGLVNEYIRPCQIRVAGITREVEALGGHEVVNINGTTYESRYTSGGVGTLIVDFPGIPNIDYKTLRYPGHYAYVEQVIARVGTNFEAIRNRFKGDLAWTDKDVIVVYAKASGVDSKGDCHVRTFGERFHGTHGLSAIQTTTAGGGLAVLELMLRGAFLPGAEIGHRDISMDQFNNTNTARITYEAGKCS